MIKILELGSIIETQLYFEAHCKNFSRISLNGCPLLKVVRGEAHQRDENILAHLDAFLKIPDTLVWSVSLISGYYFIQVCLLLILSKLRVYS